MARFLAALERRQRAMRGWQVELVGWALLFLIGVGIGLMLTVHEGVGFLIAFPAAVANQLWANRWEARR